MQINIATLFDKNYAMRAIAFYNSLAKLGQYKFWFLCLDDETKEMMKKLELPDVIFMTIEELNDRELLNTESNRSRAEFIFTSKSCLVHYVMNKIADGEALIFDDCDLFYFSSPNVLIYDMEKAGYSIGIIPHQFPKHKEYLNEKVGKYNAGLLYLIADKNSRLCISKWREQCIDWCYLKYEKDRFGDQLYLNKWPGKYNGVYEIKNKGVNLGSWSIYDFKISKKDGIFYVDEDRLICYHFHRIKFYLDEKEIKPLPIYVYNKELYDIYIQELERGWGKLLKVDQNWKYGFVEKPHILRFIKQKTERVLRNIIKI